jgi:branched-chain amino acid transport system substrate-binding protein
MRRVPEPVTSAGTAKSRQFRFVRQRRWAVIAAVAALTGLATACGSGGGSANSASTSSSARTPISVLAIVATSGPNEETGTQQLAGLQAAAAYYNAHGGILRRKVQVTVANDNSDPGTAASVAIKALSTDPGKYSMIFAGEESVETAALIPIIARYKIYATALSDGNQTCVTASACPTQFDVTGKLSLPTAAAAQYIEKEGYKNVGIVGEQLDFTQTEVSYLQSDLKKLDIKTEVAEFPQTALSLTPEVLKLKSDGAQAVFAAVFGQAAAYVLDARSALAWHAPVIFDLVGSSEDISKLAPMAELSGAQETVAYCGDLSHNIPAFSALFTYGRSTVNESLPCNLVGGGWTAMVLFRNAATEANSVNPTALANATESMKPLTSSSLVIPYARYCYTKTDHENVCSEPSDYSILPVGTIAGTRLHSLSSSP